MFLCADVKSAHKLRSLWSSFTKFSNCFCNTKTALLKSNNRFANINISMYVLRLKFSTATVNNSSASVISAYFQLASELRRKTKYRHESSIPAVCGLKSDYFISTHS